MMLGVCVGGFVWVWEGCRLINSWITSDESSNLEQRPSSGSGTCECVSVCLYVCVCWRAVALDHALVGNLAMSKPAAKNLTRYNVIMRSYGVNNNTFCTDYETFVLVVLN